MLAACRLYAILDTAYVAPDRWESIAADLAEAPVDIVQIRAKGHTTDAIVDLTQRVIALFREARIPVIINDDLEATLHFPDTGLHLGQDDLDPAYARRQLGSGRLLGLSTHSPSQARNAIARASLLDYFAVGPVFATPTKPDYIPVGLELVAAVHAMNPPLPFFCIGGITASNLDKVIAAGAARVVVVSHILKAKSPVETARHLRARIPRP